MYGLVDKLGAPINKLSNKVGSEAFWPTTLDKESDKAARILRSFCKDGFYVQEEQEGRSAEGVPKGKVRVVKKIPTSVIKKAKGLAIFTTMRTGLWVSGAGGSGILVARTASGAWSPPSGILLHTAGLGFLVGVDIYDCVVVINTEKALEAFTKIRCTLGGEVSAVAGPVGVGGVLETELHKRQAPVWNYLKSRGFYAGVQIDGTVIIERTDENERFYGERIGVADILAGKARHPPPDIKTLMATIRAAQGDLDVDENALPSAEPTPGDYEIEGGSDSFGLPAEDDPDPFGVHALEKEGLEIREAGTRERPSSDAFEYKPAPSSPIYGTFRRHSFDSKNSRRSSRHSINSVDRGTQTEILGSPSSPDAPMMHHSPLQHRASPDEEDEKDIMPKHPDHVDHDVEVSEVGQAVKPQVISRAKMVTIPKRIPPALPPRNPYRTSASSALNGEALRSPSTPDQQMQIPQLVHTPSQDTADPIGTREEDLEHGMETIRLSGDYERLPPRKDDFDPMSRSVSNYSRDEPNDAAAKITLEDQNNDDHKDNAANGNDEFHSIPSTPIEGPSHGGKGEGHSVKDDFS